MASAFFSRSRKIRNIRYIPATHGRCKHFNNNRPLPGNPFAVPWRTYGSWLATSVCLCGLLQRCPAICMKLKASWRHAAIGVGGLSLEWKSRIEIFSDEPPRERASSPPTESSLFVRELTREGSIHATRIPSSDHVRRTISNSHLISHGMYRISSEFLRQRVSRSRYIKHFAILYLDEVSAMLSVF